MEERSGRGGGQGPQDVGFRSALGGLGEPESGERGLALLIDRRSGELELWGGWGDWDQGRLPLWA